MFDLKVLDFFKRHNLFDQEMFDYISKQCSYVDYYDKNVNFCIGCAPKINNKTNRIEGFLLTVPYCWNEITRLVCIHEIAHAIYWYKNIGQKYNEIEIELFPMLLERVYLKENNSPELEAYINFLDSTIDEESKESYRFALENRDELLKRDINNYEKIKKTTHQLVKKWKRNNR